MSQEEGGQIQRCRVDGIASVGDRYSIPRDHPYEKLRKFISNVHHENKKGVEFIYRLQFSIGQVWPQGHKPSGRAGLGMRDY